MSTSNLFVNAIKMTQQVIPHWKIKKGDDKSSLRKKKSPSAVTTVGSLLKTMQEVPSHTILLGQCTDGLPFMMELGDPELGAILIGCDAACGKTHQLQVMADSAMQTHSPHEMQFAILSSNPSEWVGLQSNTASEKYIYDLRAWYDGRTEQTIEALTELAEARRESKRLGPDILMFLDDLEHIEDLSYGAQVNLHWLLEYGAQSGMWVIGTIDPHLTNGFRYWVDPFRTRIVGRIHDSEDADIIAMRPHSSAADLDHGRFRVWTGNCWLTYSLVPLGR